MQSVDLKDDLTLKLGAGDRVTVQTDLSFLPDDDRNLAAQAARSFFAATEQTRDLSIKIHKRIPVCAGMAGGSSDAAAVFRALNQASGAGLSAEELARLGAQVGSDVPYCILGGTVLAEGRGERLTVLPQLPDCQIVICKPAFSISPPELFGLLRGTKLRCRPDTEGVLSALEAGDLAGVARRMYNVFEDVLPARQAKMVQEIKQVLIGHGALGACMSGTGPTVFGLFQKEEHARQAKSELCRQHRDVFFCKPV